MKQVGSDDPCWPLHASEISEEKKKEERVQEKCNLNQKTHSVQRALPKKHWVGHIFTLI